MELFGQKHMHFFTFWESTAKLPLEKFPVKFVSLNLKLWTYPPVEACPHCYIASLIWSDFTYTPGFQVHQEVTLEIVYVLQILCKYSV